MCPIKEESSKLQRIWDWLDKYSIQADKNLNDTWKWFLENVTLGLGFVSLFVLIVVVTFTRGYLIVIESADLLIPILSDPQTVLLFFMFLSLVVAGIALCISFSAFFCIQLFIGFRKFVGNVADGNSKWYSIDGLVNFGKIVLSGALGGVAALLLSVLVFLFFSPTDLVISSGIAQDEIDSRYYLVKQEASPAFRVAEKDWGMVKEGDRYAVCGYKALNIRDPIILCPTNKLSGRDGAKNNYSNCVRLKNDDLMLMPLSYQPVQIDLLQESAKKNFATSLSLNRCVSEKRT